MPSRIVQFDVDSVLKLLVHYSEGELPLNSEVKQVQISQYLPRWISLIVEADDWTGTPYEAGDGYGGIQPMMIRYEGKRTMVLDHLQNPVSWSEPGEIEAPTRTD